MVPTKAKPAGKVRGAPARARKAVLPKAKPPTSLPPTSLPPTSLPPPRKGPDPKDPSPKDSTPKDSVLKDEGAKFKYEKDPRIVWVVKSLEDSGLKIQENSLDIVVCNTSLAWVPLEKAFREVFRVLKNDGIFVFSSFGPDTLIELRTSFAHVDDLPHVHLFLDLYLSRMSRI